MAQYKKHIFRRRVLDSCIASIYVSEKSNLATLVCDIPRKWFSLVMESGAFYPSFFSSWFSHTPYPTHRCLKLLSACTNICLSCMCNCNCNFQFSQSLEDLMAGSLAREAYLGRQVIVVSNKYKQISNKLQTNFKQISNKYQKRNIPHKLGWQQVAVSNQFKNQNA